MTDPTPKQPEWLIEGYPKLEGNAEKEAVRSQTIKYPMVVRQMDDPPIPNQMFANISFMFFDEPKTLSSGKKVYGFCKVRGVWPTEQSATNDCKRLIREVDSRFQIRIAPVGAWVPLTNENAFCRDLLDVGSSVSQMEINLRNDAIKEKESEQRRIINELKEREQEVTDEDIYDDKSTLRYYSMRRVTEMRLSEAVQINRMKLNKILKNQLKVRAELKHLEKDFPEYPSQWVDCYNIERRKAGIFEYVPGEDEFTEYEEVPLEHLEEALAAAEDEKEPYLL